MLARTSLIALATALVALVGTPGCSVTRGQSTVGEYVDDNSSRGETLAVHWDGSTWNVVPSPNPGALYNYFQGVAIVAADDAWAVGYYGHGDTPVTLIAHWDGSNWSTVSSPNVDLASNWPLGSRSARASSTFCLSGTMAPRRKPPSEVITIFACES